MKPEKERHIVDGTEHIIGSAPNPECLLCRIESLEAEAMISENYVLNVKTKLAQAREAWADFDQEKLDELLGEPRA